VVARSPSVPAGTRLSAQDALAAFGAQPDWGLRETVEYLVGRRGPRARRPEWQEPIALRPSRIVTRSSRIITGITPVSGRPLIAMSGRISRPSQGQDERRQRSEPGHQSHATLGLAELTSSVRQDPPGSLSGQRRGGEPVQGEGCAVTRMAPTVDRIAAQPC
jgi:hypothetical protein